MGRLGYAVELVQELNKQVGGLDFHGYLWHVDLEMQKDEDGNKYYEVYFMSPPDSNKLWYHGVISAEDVGNEKVCKVQVDNLLLSVKDFIEFPVLASFTNLEE